MQFEVNCVKLHHHVIYQMAFQGHKEAKKLLPSICKHTYTFFFII